MGVASPRGPRRTPSHEYSSHASRLEKNGDKFVDEYQALCLKYKMMVDTACGDPTIETVSKSDILKQCKDLHKSVETGVSILKTLSSGNRFGVER